MYLGIFVNETESESESESESAPPPNNLLKFVHFVCEKGCDCQSRGNEDWNSYIFEEARIYPKCNIF